MLVRDVEDFLGKYISGGVRTEARQALIGMLDRAADLEVDGVLHALSESERAYQDLEEKVQDARKSLTEAQEMISQLIGKFI